MNKEKRYRVFTRDFFTCQNCGAFLPASQLQVAHRVRQDSSKNETTTVKMVQEFWAVHFNKTISKKYAKEKIIDNPLNTVTVCSLRCNSKFNIFFMPEEVKELLYKIYWRLENEDI